MDEATTAPLPMSREAARLRRVLFASAWALLVVVGGIKFCHWQVGGQRTTTVARMQEIEKALARYAVDNSGAVPSSRQGLKALLTKPDTKPVPPNWHGPYLSSDEYLEDAWGRPFQYVAPGGLEPDIEGIKPISRAYDIWSLGADGREDGTGVDASIRSWEGHTGAP